MTTVRFEVRGVVQGVGFRPFVHRLASELGLSGVVGNDSSRVFIELGGPDATLREFEERLVQEAPPLALIEEVRRCEASDQFDLVPGSGFTIVESERVDGERTFVSPDVALCDACLREMSDPSDRRFAHPFITCTNCGPRFTITRALPYDRPNTTMAGFEMCETCEAEYHDPTDRRFHAQPIGCHDCGPSLTWMGSRPDIHMGSSDLDAVGAAALALADGAIVSIKGLGGFHLACDATSDAAVQLLRDRKRRPDKPLAVMVADLEMARELAHVTEREAELLSSAAAPVVLCRARADSPLSPLVAPGNPLVGLVLPYTPVHHLLLTDRSGTETPQRAVARRCHLGPLVMTSGNLGGEPIAFRDDDAFERLAPLVDGFLTHDRPIHLPCDDSVVRVVSDQLLPIRRARGHAPLPVSLGTPAKAPDVLAVGGELKNTFCVASGGYAWMSQHIGDMENLDTLQAFEASVEQFCDLYDIHPQLVAADTHPAYLSSSWARTNHGDRVVGIQHHHAHVAAVMAEHGLIPSEPVLGVAFDGTGDGQDGTVWGGELLLATATEFERLAHLSSVPMPGGDEAARHPWRAALAHLWAADLEWSDTLPPVGQAGTECALVRQQLDRGINAVPTSSMGRFFDALASLIGIRQHVSYEAQAAIELEIAAVRWRERAEPTPTLQFRLDDPARLVRSVVEHVKAGTPTGALALALHEAIVAGVAFEVRRLCARHGVNTVVLSGGCFQNALLTELLTTSLEPSLDVRTHHLVPPNDGGLALGQAFIAHHRFSASELALQKASLGAKNEVTTKGA